MNFVLIKLLKNCAIVSRTLVYMSAIDKVLREGFWIFKMDIHIHLIYWTITLQFSCSLYLCTMRLWLRLSDQDHCQFSGPLGRLVNLLGFDPGAPNPRSRLVKERFVSVLLGYPHMKIPLPTLLMSQNHHNRALFIPVMSQSTFIYSIYIKLL
jgi:hypothetical protein